MRSLAILVIGLILGWALHSVTDKQPEIVSDIEVIAPTTENDPQQDTLLLTETLETEPIKQTAPAEPLAEKPTQKKAVDHQADLNQLSIALKNRDTDLALAICNSLYRAGQIECRSKLLEFNSAVETENVLGRELLHMWLFDHPEDMEVAIILAKEAAGEERFVDAARLLASARSYQIEPEAIESISRQIQQLARASMIKLDLREDFVTQKSLLRIFTEIEPERAAWRYSLARALINLNDYASALEALSYILFDPDYGERANVLYDQISQRINLASYSVASLQRTGSQFLVTARLNGIHELMLLLDTGASLTSIRADKLNQLGLKSASGQQIVLNTAGGQIRSTLVQLNSLSVGGQPIRNLNVASLENFESTADGLLGMDFLRHFKFVIDQSNRSLHLTPK